MVSYELAKYHMRLSTCETCLDKSKSATLKSPPNNNNKS